MKLFVCFWRNSPHWARTSPFTKFLDHIRHTTVGRTPLDEWSVRRRDHYLTAHNTTDKHPCPRWGSNPQSQQAATGTGQAVISVREITKCVCLSSDILWPQSSGIWHHVDLDRCECFGGSCGLWPQGSQEANLVLAVVVSRTIRFFMNPAVYIIYNLFWRTSCSWIGNCLLMLNMTHSLDMTVRWQGRGYLPL